jgi:hypothetical protein
MSRNSTVRKNTLAEDAEIAEGIVADPDTSVPTDAEWEALYGKRSVTKRCTTAFKSETTARKAASAAGLTSSRDGKTGRIVGSKAPGKDTPKRA